MKKVVVVGSGLSGMAAAVRLVDAGYKPLIIERHAHIGGRTASWTEDGMYVESGLHRYLGFYTHLPKLLRHVGVNIDDIVCWEDEVEIRHPRYPYTVLALAPMHKPIKMFHMFIDKSEFLSAGEKIALLRFFIAGTSRYVSDPRGLDTLTLKDLANEYDIKLETLEKILVPTSEGIFFLPIDQYSAYAFFGLFLPHVLRFPKTRVGAFAGGMSEVMMKPLERYVHERGGEVVRDSEVTKLQMDRAQIRGVEINGVTVKTDAVVLATSLGPAQFILKNSTDHPFFTPMHTLLTMPSVTMQFELDEPALPVDRTTFGPTTALASFSEQSRTTFPDSKGRLSVILSNPDRFIHMRPDDIANRVIEDAQTLGMNLQSHIVSFRKISEPNDFYMLSPGSADLRPTQQTPIHGLVLAGDYTRQRYLATMEGAVYSGQRAAEALLPELKSP